MKTKLTLIFSLILLTLSPAPSALSQIPQGFNYQAVARNGSGSPVINTPLPVRITIQSDSLGGTIFWQELHSSVTSNGSGVINLVIGKGVKQAGSAVSFSDITWSVTPKFIKAEINLSGWKTMGSSRFWSVPYSLVAKDVTGPVRKLDINGTEASLDSALFEVKNKQGQTIFAVYNEGVRVYVDNGAKGAKGGFAVGGFDMAKGTKQTFLAISDDSVKIYIDSNPLTKKPKGGFAVGGYDMAKGTVQNYLDVNADSIRMYIDKSTKSKKGGFAVGSFDMSKGGKEHFLDVATDASGKIVPPQNRILWYPLKNAFLTGRVRIGTPDSVGINSFASGYESKARGMYSQALGFKAIATGDYSTAIGKNAVANDINSFAFGDSARAINNESYAIGRGAVASGYRSFAFGSAGRDSANMVTDVTQAPGDYSFAIGQGSQASGTGAFTMGLADTAKGKYSLALGYKSSATKYGATAIGTDARATGQSSTAMGTGANAKGYYSTAIGHGALASGNSSISMGESTRAMGGYSTALGEMTTAGYGSTAMGGFTTASGDYSTAMGQFTTATKLGATAMGASTRATGGGSTAMGFQTQASGDGSTAMGTSVISRGKASTAMGDRTISKPLVSLTIGRFNDTTCSVNGSVNWVESDPIFIAGNGPDNLTRKNAFTVLKNGNTAIGHASPSQMLDVNGNARFRSIGSGIFAYNLNITSDGTLTTATSDAGMKENIYQITDALDQVNRLRGVTFNWKNDSTNVRQMGMIAQEVELIVPEIVFTNPVDGLKGINYSQTTALLVEAIKEQQHQIESFKSENDNLKAQLQTLQEKVVQIEALMMKKE